MTKRLFGKWSFWIGLGLALPMPVRAVVGMWMEEKAAGPALLVLLAVMLGVWLLRSAYGNCRNIEIRSPDGYTGFRQAKDGGDVLVTFTRNKP